MKKESVCVSVPIKVDGIKDLENQKVETKSDAQLMKQIPKSNTFKKVFLLSVLTVFIVSMVYEKRGCCKFFEAAESNEEIVGFTSPENGDELSPKEKSATEQKVTEAEGQHGWKHNEEDCNGRNQHGGEDHWHRSGDGDWNHHEGGWNSHDHHSRDGDWDGHGDWSPHGHHSGDGDWRHHSHSWDNKDGKRGHHMFGSWNHDSHSHSHDQPLPVELDSEDEAPIIDNNNNVIEDESLDHDVEESEDVEISNELESEEEPAVGEEKESEEEPAVGEEKESEEKESEEEPAVGEETESMTEPNLEGLDVATLEEKEDLNGNN